MATIYRVRVALTGFTGAPGVQTWFLGLLPGLDELTESAANTAGAALRTFYTAASQTIQPDVVQTVEPFIDAIEDSNGNLVGVIPVTSPPDSATGAGSGSASHATMLKIRLLTDSFVDGRRVRGGPYLGPIAGNAITAASDIESARRTQVNNGLQALATALEANLTPLVVWQRPREASATLDARDGSSHLVTAVSCGTRPAVLRSRRD